MECPPGVRHSVFGVLPEDIQMEIILDQIKDNSKSNYIDEDSVRDLPYHLDDLAISRDFDEVEDLSEDDNDLPISRSLEIDTLKGSSKTSKIFRRCLTTHQSMTNIADRALHMAQIVKDDEIDQIEGDGDDRSQEKRPTTKCMNSTEIDGFSFTISSIPKSLGLNSSKSTYDSANNTLPLSPMTTDTSVDSTTSESLTSQLQIPEVLSPPKRPALNRSDHTTLTLSLTPQKPVQTRGSRGTRLKLEFTSSSGSLHSTTDWSYSGERNFSGKFHGKGTLFMDGSIYDGQFAEGRRHGVGTLTKANGSTYNGGWKDDLYDGFGTYKNPTGYMYRGHYRLGRRHGHGECHFPNGDEYIGEWVNGEMEGAGVYRYVNGDIYEGFFKENKRHGPGGYQYAKNHKLDIDVYERGIRKNAVGVLYSKTGKKAREIMGEKKGAKISASKAKDISRSICGGLTFGELLFQLRERQNHGANRGIKWHC
eukprot:15366379-Ditylum_brightwellii.AAC.2